MSRPNKQLSVKGSVRGPVSAEDTGTLTHTHIHTAGCDRIIKGGARTKISQQWNLKWRQWESIHYKSRWTTLEPKTSRSSLGWWVVDRSQTPPPPDGQIWIWAKLRSQKHTSNQPEDTLKKVQGLIFLQKYVCSDRSDDQGCWSWGTEGRQVIHTEDENGKRGIWAANAKNWLTCNECACASPQNSLCKNGTFLELSLVTSLGISTSQNQLYFY